MKKIKLPRKRKKAYIKERGVNNYQGMRKYFLVDEEKSKFPKQISMVFNEKGTPDFKTESYW